MENDMATPKTDSPDNSIEKTKRSFTPSKGCKVSTSPSPAAAKLCGELGLDENEAGFYSALAENESAVRAMGNDELKIIAAELVTQVRNSVTIDWTLRESARAKINGASKF